MHLNMDVILLFVIVLVLRSAEPVPYRTEDFCSYRTSCGSCLAVLGCQWCASQIMWLNTTQARCRSRPISPEAETGWCPPDQLVDPVDHRYSVHGEHAEFQLSPFFVSPESIHIETRMAEVDVSFKVKMKTGVEVSDLKTDTDLPIQHLTETIFKDEHWTVYSYNVTLPAPCTRNQHTFNLSAAGGRAVSVTVSRTNCGCGCGRPDTPRAPDCGGHGTLRCGGCECDPKWSGAACEVALCQERGDLDLCRAPDADRDCAGVGECVCGRCVCPPPSFYFDEYCTDTCTATAACALCHSRLGNTSDLPAQRHSAGTLPGIHACHDECLATELVSAGAGADGRLCVVDDEGCEVQYVSWRGEGAARLQLLASNCSASGVLVAAAGGLASGSIVGLALGSLAGVLLAAGGAAAWRASRAPRDPLAGHYEHMGAESTRGENPLYKSPTSKYINPLYQHARPKSSA